MAGLTKQHFEEIARIVKGNIKEDKYSDDWFIDKLLLQDLEEYFKTQNPNFDEKRFKEACLK